jgi:signal transduction histidine kinase
MGRGLVDAARSRFIHTVDSIRFRISLAATLLFALALSLGANLLTSGWEDQLSSRTSLELSRAADDILANHELGLPPFKISFVPSTSMYYRFILPDGEVISGYLRPANPDEPQPPARQPGSDVDGTVTDVHSTFPLGNVRQLMLERTVPFGDDIGKVTVVAPLEHLSGAVSSLVRLLLWGIPLLVLFNAGLLWLVTGRALRPVAALGARTEQITLANLDSELPRPRHDDEIARLTQHLDNMFDRLRDARNRQRQFVSDASHELRSPVSTIMALTETATRHPDSTDWLAVSEQVHREALRLSVLIQDLLDLARLQEGMPVLRTEIDVADVLMDDAERVLASAELRGLVVDTTGVQPLAAFIDRERFEHALRNMTDNAVRHARNVVRLSSQVDGALFEVRVCDDGEGVPPEEREAIFDRFVRLDEGRARDGGGAGLGLPVARAVAVAHGGTLHVEENSDGGACFVFRAPLA